MGAEAHPERQASDQAPSRGPKSLWNPSGTLIFPLNFKGSSPLPGQPMDQIADRVLRFDRFALDLNRGCLRAEDREIDLRPKAFEVLRHLAENAGQLVSKDELYQIVWP